MNSCKAYVDRVWDEGEAFGEGGGGVLSEKKTGILVQISASTGVCRTKAG